MNIGAIIQARVSSTRLPGKVLLELPYASGITVLSQVIRRLNKSKKLSSIIVATTVEECDTKIVDIARAEKLPFYRGSKNDVLSRYYLAAKANKLDAIVRITSDCPCIDPLIVDSLVKKHIAEQNDYTTNFLVRTFPRGLDCEVCTFNALEKAYFNAKDDYEHEHVTPYIQRRPKMFKIGLLRASKPLFFPNLRITIDTEEDYALLCVIFDYLYTTNKYFTSLQLVKLFIEKPWLKLINKKVLQKKEFKNVGAEIKEALRLLELNELKISRDLLNQAYKK